MKLLNFKRSENVCRSAALSIFFVFMSTTLSAQVGLKLPQPESPLTPLISPVDQGRFSLADAWQNQTITYPKSFVYKTKLDSAGEQVSITYRLKEYDIFAPQYVTLDQYLKRRSRIQTQRQWQDHVYYHLNDYDIGSQKGRGLSISTPKIESKAFRSIFGGDRMSLNVTGQITIDGGMRNEKRSQNRTALNRGANTNFEMKQTQQFKVEGKIGENVSIFVDQNSERTFEFENAVKIKYSSDEDGIVKSIDAGNVSLSLPGTRFVTVGGSSAGLFGIKSELKVGPLDITAIASVEKSQKKKLSISGGQQEEELTIEDYNYKKYTYFFLDDYYRENFEKYSEDRLHIINPDSMISKLEVYKYDGRTDESTPYAIQAWAVPDPEASVVDTSNEDLENRKWWMLNVDPSEYELFPEIGAIALNTSLMESEVLAIAYRDTSGKEVGDFYRDFIDPDSAGHQLKIPLLKLIKTQNPQPRHKSWDLEWKNVYSLGGRNIEEEGFECTIYRINPGGEDIESAQDKNGNVKSLLNIFGLDETNANGDSSPDNEIDFHENFLNLRRGELIFPNLRPFDPEPDAYKPFPNSLDEFRNSVMYDTTNMTQIRNKSTFYMAIKSTSARSSSYQLGLNVVEGSEEITLNGQKLIKDQDYVIDYFSGNLTLLSERAMDPNANLDISYESQKMFSVDRKTLWGARAEYTLWERGNSRSFIGATFLSLNEKTLDQKVRVGKGPMSNSVWDVNGAVKFESEGLSKFLNDLPVLTVNGKSSFNFEGEVAQVLPNPNTLNNSKTGDTEGVAYLDDFEGARRQVNLGVAYNMWSQCSPPRIPNGDGTYTEKDIQNRSYFYWYNPINMVRITEVWPNREVTTQMGGSTQTHALTFNVSPADTLSIEDQKKQWNGVMRGLSSGYHDQTESRFLEIWVQGTHGRLNIDLGTISEDVIPNKKLNTEDQKDENGIRNKQLDEGEDTGLDGMFGDDPPSPFYPHVQASVGNDNKATPYDFWDLNNNKIKEENEPWSYDDYKYADRGSNYDQINGTEDNEAASVAIYPDTEDLNGNSGLDITNNYFEYSFSLEETHPDTQLVEGRSNNSANWRMFRIPLDEPSKVIGNPEWTRIEYARVWVDSVYKNATTIKIVELNIVGNEWIAMDYDTTENIYSPTEDETMSIAVYNTHDNSDAYVPPKGVEGVRDPIQKIRAKEQALQLKIQDLMPGEQTIAQKLYLEDMDLINYKTLKMFLHGGERMPEEVDSDVEYAVQPMDQDLEFFIQLSSDTKNENYYEVNIPVYKGWNYNDIEVPLESWTNIKLDPQKTRDSIEVKLVETSSHGSFQIKNYLYVKGTPSLRKIRTITIGIRNLDHTAFTGEVWLNELRLSNVRKDKGMAMRFSGNISLGDFFKINGGYDRKDADFRTVSNRLGEGNNTEGFNINSSIQVDRLLPQTWGINLPVSVNYKESKSTPKYIPGSDILITDSTPDTTVEKNQSHNTTKGISVSFSKQRSRNKFLRYFLDPINTNFSYSHSENSDSQTKYSNNTSYRGSIGYNLRLGKDSYVTPLTFMGKGLFQKISTLKFYYLPSNFTVKMSGADTWRDALTRSKIETKAGDTRTATFTRSLSSNYAFTDGIDFQYTRDWAFDMRDSKFTQTQETDDDTSGQINYTPPTWNPNTFLDDWQHVFSSFTPGDLRSEKQSFSGKVNLKLFKWLKNDFSYSGNYQLKINPQMKSEDTKRSTQASNNIKISGTFDPKKFVEGFGTKKTKRSSRRTGGRRTSSRRNRQTQDEPEKTEEKEKEGPSILLKPLSIAGDLFSKIDPIRFSLTQSRSGNHYGVLTTPPNAYQFGFNVDLDTTYLSNQITSNQSTLSDDNRLTLSTGFNVISSLTVKLDYSLADNEKQSTQRTGSITESALMIKEGDPITFPNWTVNWRGLEKLPFVKKYVQSASMNHAFSGKKTENWSETKNNITTSTYSKDFRPLVGMNMTLKNKMAITFQYNTSIKLQEKNQYGAGRTRQINNTMNFSVKYQKKGGMRIPLFGNKKLNNNIDFSMAVTSTLSKTEQSNSDEGNFSVMSETKNWSVKPKMTYSFTNTVRGGVHFELGEREDKRTGKTKITALGINAVISLSGR